MQNGSFSVPFLNIEVVTGLGYSTEPEMRDHGQVIDGFLDFYSAMQKTN
jgi:hypothetical protein